MTAYTPNLKLGQPAVADRNWNVAVNANAAALEALSPLAALNVSPTEIPSATLNVRVAPGGFVASGTLVNYAGSTSTTLAATSTIMLWLDSSGVLHTGASFPVVGSIVPLATVVTGSTTITSVTDNRVVFAVLTY